ncbi:MAG: hypothetical protein Q8Q50_00400 [Methylobacter sp.]|nr:hypothetical protein [Methylobacter sp.]
MAVFNSNKWLQILNKRQALHREMMECNESYRAANTAFYRRNWDIPRTSRTRHLDEIFAADSKLSRSEFATKIARIRHHWKEESPQRLGGRPDEPDDPELQRALLKKYDAFLEVIVLREKYEAHSDVYAAHGAGFNRLNEVATRHNEGHNPVWNAVADSGAAWS